MSTIHFRPSVFWQTINFRATVHFHLFGPPTFDLILFFDLKKIFDYPTWLGLVFLGNFECSIRTNKIYSKSILNSPWWFLHWWQHCLNRSDHESYEDLKWPWSNLLNDPKWPPSLFLRFMTNKKFFLNPLNLRRSS